MSWFKVNDTLPMSRKVLRIPRARRATAMGLWVLAGAWSASELTDGHVPAFMVDEWADEQAARDLVDVGLWDAAADGYQFHDWNDWQPTRADVMSKRKAEREKKAQQRARGTANVGRDGDTGRFASPQVTDLSPRVSPGDNPGTPPGSPRPVPPESPGVSPASPARPDPTRPQKTSSSVDRAPRDTRLPATWAPTDEHRKRATELGLDLDREAQKFRLHAEENDRHAKSWNAAFTRWLINSAEYARRDRTAPRRPTTDDRVAEGIALTRRLAAEAGHQPHPTFPLIGATP
ncbi:hypothetical protein JN535_08465 [Cellulosimicrobium cellulans]|uniref:hypothetical protein n=1 Tax=Cellulosimicrobium cellulans TaxID=1710 RepID=UPI0019662321|nr:hypothetical protein [Cellulosimicrobium cellulans]MBN0040198.1 hypothetical protein [Cellulosimicrobium cellulans]